MEKEVKVIRSAALSPVEYFQRAWKFRRLIGVLVQRDFKAAFAQTVLGWLWLVIKPCLVLLLFTVFFDRLLHLDTSSVQYPAFAFAGMSLWYFFSNIVHSTGSALLQSTDLIRKIYFPKIILLVSKSAYAGLDLLIHLAILVVLAAVYGHPPTIKWLLTLPVILLVYLAGLTVGIWLNSLSLRHRDLQHLVPQLVNLAIWLTPVFYPVSIIPREYHPVLYLLNPIASAIDGLRFAFFDLQTFPKYIAINSFVVILLLLGGLYTFIRKERNLVDTL